MFVHARLIEWDDEATAVVELGTGHQRLQVLAGDVIGVDPWTGYGSDVQVRVIPHREVNDDLFEVTLAGVRMELPMSEVHSESPATYADLSIAARQAVAIVGLRRWARVRGLDPRVLNELTEHLWAYQERTARDPGFWDSWYEKVPRYLLTTSAPLGPEIVAAAASAGVAPEVLHRVLVDVMQVTYRGLFGSPESEDSLELLDALDGVFTADGAVLPDADLFAQSLWLDSDWGEPAASVTLAWRELAGE